MKNLILGLLMSSMIFGPMVSVAGNQKHVSGCIVRSSFGIHSMTDGGTHGVYRFYVKPTSGGIWPGQEVMFSITKDGLMYGNGEGYIQSDVLIRHQYLLRNLLSAAESQRKVKINWHTSGSPKNKAPYISIYWDKSCVYK